VALTDGLVAYYKMDDASGADAADAHSGGRTLTQHNAVGSAAGKVGTSRSFSAASSQRLTSSSASFQTGAAFTLAFWAYLNNKSDYRDLVTRLDNDTAKREFRVMYRTDSDSFYADAWDVSGAFLGSASSPAAVSSATWYFVVVRYWASLEFGDPALQIRVDNGSAGANFLAGVISPTDALFMVGGQGNGAGADLPHDGRIDELGYWSRELTAAEETELHNGGAGLTYPFGAGGAAPKAMHYSRLRRA
jgi:hypothetical protein